MKNKIFLIGLSILLIITLIFAFKSNSKYKIIKMQLVPSKDVATIQRATKKVEQVLTEEFKKQKIPNFEKVEVTVAKDYNSAFNLIKQNSIQLSTVTGGNIDYGIKKLLTTTRKEMNADETIKPSLLPKIDDEKELINNWNKDFKVNEKKDSKTRYYRSVIWSKKNSKISKYINKKIQEQGNNWKGNFNDVKDDIKIAYSSTVSSGSYVYFEKWVKKHFDNFDSFAISLPKENQRKLTNGVGEQFSLLKQDKVTMLANYSEAMVDEEVSKSFNNDEIKSLNVIGISEKIDNDGIASNKDIDKDVLKKISDGFINIIHTKKGQEAFKDYYYEDFIVNK